MPTVEIVRGRHDVQFAEQLRVDLALRQWSVELGSFSLGGHDPGGEHGARPVVAIVPSADDDLADFLAWVTGALQHGTVPLLISPETLALPGSILREVGGVVFRGSTTYDQVFEGVFRSLLGALPPWLDVAVRPGLVQSPTGVAWWADDLFVADDKYDHVVRISPSDSTVVVPGLFEPQHVAVHRRQLVVANSFADEIISCDIVDNMAARVEGIQVLDGMPLRHPHAAVFGSRVSVVADTDNDRVVFSVDGSAQWHPLHPAVPFSKPGGVCVDESGIWVADTLNHRLVRFSLAGHELASFGSYGEGELEFTLPVGVQSWGELLFVADQLSERLKVFQITTSSDGGVTVESIFDDFGGDWICQPFGLSVNRNNRMAVTDRKQKCIWLVDLAHVKQQDALRQ